ncbi:response regulator [Paenibacillus yanchengensis]|uniref:Response regulator n=1 Tax=Paenibacillus yanchengensis TaxID=2035833 RepID=A0ABW4YIB3_9BACL
MYRLLIVDDEPIIVESLLDLFEKKSLDLEVYGVFSSSAALQVLDEMKIDIVLTDIQMPGMNGLELHKQIIASWPWCRVIFLTGYDDFSYIQSAVRNGTVDYLLKMEGNEVIVQAIEKAIADLNNAIEVEQLIARSREQTLQIEPFMRKELLWGLMQSNNSKPSGLGQQFADLHIPLDASKHVITVIGRIDQWRESTNSFDKSLFLFAIQNIARDYFQTHTHFESFDFSDKSKIAWLLQPIDKYMQTNRVEETTDWKRVLTFIKGAVETIQMAVKKLLNIKISFAIATVSRPWSELPEQAELLNLMLGRGLGLGEELLLLEQPDWSLAYDVDHHLLRKAIKQMPFMQEMLENGQQAVFFGAYEELMHLAGSVSGHKERVRSEIYFTWVSIFLSYLNRWQSTEQLAEQFPLARITMLDYTNNWQEVTDYFYQLATLLFAERETNQGSQEQDVITQVQHYVQKNIAGDVSLNRIAEVVGHNPSYLSRLYKNVTGNSISEHISEIKINKIKELLQENRLKTSEIAKAVGFLSEQSFYRFFRKATQLTPQEFREKMQK